jgi:hypothetical protein
MHNDGRCRSGAWLHASQVERVCAWGARRNTMVRRTVRHSRRRVMSHIIPMLLKRPRRDCARTVSEITLKSLGDRSFGYEWFDHLESTGECLVTPPRESSVSQTSLEGLPAHSLLHIRLRHRWPDAGRATGPRR